jgi:hypothetical protein
MGNELSFYHCYRIVDKMSSNERIHGGPPAECGLGLIHDYRLVFLGFFH